MVKQCPCAFFNFFALWGAHCVMPTNAVIKFISQLTNQKFPVIGSGGIHDYDSAQRKLDAGAILLQVYTSFIYEGPLWPSRLAKRIPLAKAWA